MQTTNAADEGLSLDDLFKKTQAKPAVYWLPLTDSEVAEKKDAAGVADAAAPQAGDAPAE
jgi:RNSP1-SAP18 binding (RSB) motif